MAKEGNLNVKGLACAGGIIWGVDLFLHALFASMGAQSLWWNNQLWPLITSAYPWITPTFGGAIIGLITGFVSGAVCGGIFAWLYNTCKNRWG